MRHSIPPALVVAFFVLATAGCRGSGPAPGRPRYRDATLAPAVRAADLVARMTRAEKVSQLMTSAPAIPRLGVQAYDWWNEALHGVARAGRATVFPQAIALAATFDEPLVRRVAEVISEEARAKYNQAQARGARGRYHGLTFFSPNVNIFRDPRWGRGQETFGEDPLLTARLGVGFIQGMQGEDPRYLKTLATAKHFAVHSGPEAARHSFDARASDHDLTDTYLPQFEAAVREARVGSVMAAYNRVNGEASVASPRLLGEILRDQWGFSGFVVGDCGAVDDVFSGHRLATSPEAAAAASLKAGTDLDCGRAYSALGSALARGLVTEAELDRAVSRLFTARFQLGMFDPPSLVPWSTLTPATVEAPAHLTLARRAAARSMVLLQNRGGLLPIASTVRSIAVVGPTADNVPVLLANYHGTPSHPITLLDGIRAAARARGLTVTHARGSMLTEASSGQLAAATAAARASDLVVAVLGLDPRLEGEEKESRFNPAGDRLDIALPAGQQQLLEALVRTGKPIAVVLTGGSALAIPWAAEQVGAILSVWYPGAEGGHAVADVLFGEESPAGRLPITLYRSADDLPPFADYGMRGRTYRYFEGTPLYGFGHGLSYTTFRYANLAVAFQPAADSVVSVDVENTGARDGDEVVQVYVLPRGAPAYAPRRWLAAFTRVSLAQGERRTVRLTLPRQSLTLVDEAGKRHPLTGEIDVAVGGSQPDRAGRYADDQHGLVAPAHL